METSVRLQPPTPPMKTIQLFALLAIATLCASCSNTKYSAYQGQKVIEGKGGTLRTVDGVDFWENGEPDRKYKVVGVIDDSRKGSGVAGLISGALKDGDIAKAVKEHGGDGVILSSESKELTGVNVHGNSATGSYQKNAKFLVVKYVP